MVIEGRTTQQIRQFNSFKIGIGLILFILATVSIVAGRADGQQVVNASPNIGRDVILPTPIPATQPVATVAIERPPEAPTLFLDDPADVFAGERYLLTGRGEPGWEITLRTVNDFFVGETTVQPNGTWRIEVLFETIGTFAFLAEMHDTESGTLLKSDVLTVEAEQPTLPLRAPTLDRLSSAEFNSGDTISLSGTGTPLTRLGLLINDMLFEVIEVDLDGIWSFEAQFVENGTYEIYVRVLDYDSEDVFESEVVGFDVVEAPLSEVEARPTVVATALLTPTFESSEQTGLFRGGTVDISGRANPQHTLEVVVNQQVVEWLKPDDVGNWAYTMAFEIPDTYTYFVRAVDPEGSLLARSSFISLRLMPQTDLTVDADNPCASYASPGEFLPDNRYRVANCETLSSIADRAGFELADLQTANPDMENPALIEPGQILVLPEP